AYGPSRSLPAGVFEAHMKLYRERSDEMAQALPREHGLVYDKASGETLDLYPATGPGLKPVFVYIHGGYWRMLGKGDSAFMAKTFTALGISVAVVDYTLAPKVSLEEIVRQVRASIAWLWQNGAEHGVDRERIFVAGSSAGGHLATALVADGWRAALDLPEDAIKGAMPVSGVFDLEPLSRSFVNEWMKFDAAQVEALSPIRHLPRLPCRMVVAWGADETRGFHEQSAAWLAAWRGAGFAAVELEVPGRHHFDVVLDWYDPDSAMTRACAAMILDA
ncbi:MAG: alpha/beta hydrolase, partial [Caldimonas sp.]